jgi:hypothetical protein
MPIMQKNDVMKSQISMNKGTTSIWREIDIQNWTGENFKTFQEGRLNALSANSIMLTKRGTVGTYSSMYPKTRYTPIPTGYRISSGRGTSTRAA